MPELTPDARALQSPEFRRGWTFRRGSSQNLLGETSAGGRRRSHPAEPQIPACMEFVGARTPAAEGRDVTMDPCWPGGAAPRDHQRAYAPSFRLHGVGLSQQQSRLLWVKRR